MKEIRKTNTDNSMTSCRANFHAIHYLAAENELEHLVQVGNGSQMTRFQR